MQPVPGVGAPGWDQVWIWMLILVHIIVGIECQLLDSSSALCIGVYHTRWPSGVNVSFNLTDEMRQSCNSGHRAFPVRNILMVGVMTEPNFAPVDLSKAKMDESVCVHFQFQTFSCPGSMTV